MEQEACCTCATLLSAVPRSRCPPTAEQAEKPPLFDPDHEGSEKPPLPDFDDEKPPLPDHEHQTNRRLPCCSRVICHACLAQNHRYHSYCPYCQVSSSDPPPSYPHHDPPPYSPLPQQQPATAATDVSVAPSDPEKAGGGVPGDDVGGEEAEDTLHFLDHANDSVASLSLRYGVPVGVLVSELSCLSVWLNHWPCVSPPYDGGGGGGYHLLDVRAPGVQSVSVFSGKVRDRTAHLYSPFQRPPLAHSFSPKHNNPQL